ncbi:hypothetical protein HHL19_06575 [Streptomyces sp. R302]|uniref:hypothetical protein n=1 Tax=unclassified Streptomyces TaxID=2593676 RepID=UPI00145ECD77|nr:MULTISPECIES: hypothetical protein [unclassified Streptomyces]NML53382.1 hypothetical protein [Streptomyces sp. R301]NML78336.1 hypothetical protein [Streptomyces sp. R302]
MAADTMTVDELRDLRLGTLNTAITDWRTMVGRLERLATGDAGGVSAAGLSKKADAADWKGDNATVTRSFVTKTAAQFSDAAAEAKGVLAILSGAHTSFTQHKADLQTAVDELAKRNIYVNGKGGVVASVPPPMVAGDADIHKPSDTELDVAQNRITKILREASETDRIAARALRQLAENKYDFAGEGSGSLKNADREQGKADAEYWRKEIAKGKVDEWSDEKLARFNEVLEYQSDNPAFTEAFAVGLGPDGTLQFWRDLADPGQGHTPEGDRAKLLGDVQQNLSLSLANATHSHSPEMEAWKKDIIAAGGKQYGHEGIMVKPYGFQIMSNLMVKGKFDKEFLDDYGKALHTFETEKRYDPASIWGNPLIASQLDYTAKGEGDDYGTPGSDPMAGYLRAVSHNPEFATELFNREETADYLLTEREYYDEDAPYGKGDGTVQSRDALGKAMLAAGTGLNPDEPHVLDSYQHTDEQRDAFTGAMSRLAEKGDDFPPELRDDMALLLGNHGEDVHQTASSINTSEGRLNYEELLEVSKQVSRDQNAYGVLMEGVNQAIVADIHAEHKGDAKEELLRAGQTVGFMETVRSQAIDTDKGDASWPAKWGYHALGGAANFIPVVGDAVQRGVDAGAYAWQLEEQKRIDGDISDKKGENFDLRQAYLTALGAEWMKANPDHELSRAGEDDKYLVQEAIGRAAFNGNDTANGVAGA